VVARSEHGKSRQMIKISMSMTNDHPSNLQVSVCACSHCRCVNQCIPHSRHWVEIDERQSDSVIIIHRLVLMYTSTPKRTKLPQR